MDFNEPLSLSLERRVLASIIDICESYISKYPTSLEDDEKLMGDRELLGVLSRQQRMAVKLRASEKRILTRTVQAVKEELSKLPTSMRGGKDERIPMAGRSFDPLMNQVTTKTAKSVLDWVDIKGGVPPESDDPNKTTSIAERRRRRKEKID